MKKFFSFLCFFLIAFGITSCGVIAVDPNETGTFYAFSITVEGNGSVSSLENGRYKNGTIIDLSATPDKGYLFTGYFENDVLLSTESSYSITLSKDTDLVAVFVQDENEQPEEYQEVLYVHKFLQTDFTNTGYDTVAGSNEINGLLWNYDAFAYLGQSSDGIQIGSNKYPQTTPWNLSTDFKEEVIINTIAIGGKHPIGTTIKITIDEWSMEYTIQCSTYEVYYIEDINVLGSTLTISLSTTSKAIYFDLLKINCSIAKDSNLDLKTDNETATAAEPGKNGVPATAFSPITKEEYYQDVNLTLKNDELKNELNQKISEMTAYSYGNDTNIMLYTDARADDPRFLYGIYDGDSISATNSGIWNKEHVWACSQMGLGGNSRPTSSTKNKSSDLHNLRVSCQNSNGQHGNLFYDIENTSTTFFPNIAGVANESHSYTGDHRGDVARILFYMATRYIELHLDDNLDTGDDYSMGKLSVLLLWNELDPVDDFEIQRNNRIYEYQGNRNPFIDYPELASSIWGNVEATSVLTISVCNQELAICDMVMLEQTIKNYYEFI